MLHQENFEITTSETPSGGHIHNQKDCFYLINITSVIIIVGKFQGESQSGGNPLVLPHPPSPNKLLPCEQVDGIQ